MKFYFAKIIMILAIVLVGASMIASAETADAVFTGGKVYTVDEKQPWAEAIAVDGNTIAIIGSARVTCS